MAQEEKEQDSEHKNAPQRVIRFRRISNDISPKELQTHFEIHDFNPDQIDPQFENERTLLHSRDFWSQLNPNLRQHQQQQQIGAQRSFINEMQQQKKQSYFHYYFILCFVLFCFFLSWNLF